MSQSNNFQYGGIKFKCYINRNIPMLTQNKVVNHIILDEKTMKSFPKQLTQSKFNTVKGLRGLYLKEKYIYLSTFLQDSNGDYVPSTLQHVYNLQNPDAQLDPQDADTYMPAYFDNQKFVISNSPLSLPSKQTTSEGDNETSTMVYDIPVSQNQSIQNQDNATPSNAAIWGNYSYNHDNQQVQVQSELEQQLVYDKQDGKATSKTSQVNYIGQSAKNINVTTGLHWRAKKKTQIFQGQDFVITLQKLHQSTDVANIKDKSSFNTEQEYEKAIDIFAKINSLNDRANPPLNAGVVNYTTEQAVQDNKFDYVKQQNSKQLYNFRNQAYYVIVFGNSSQGYYYLIICQKAPPTFVYFDNDKLASYRLGTHNISGDSLIRGQTLTVTVRNHLGNLVIYFNKDQDNPFIIKPRADGTTNLNSVSDIFKTLSLVKNGSLQIWGGNMSTAINFSPLRYVQESTLLFPPPEKEKTGMSQASWFQTPKSNVDIVTLSQSWLADVKDNPGDTKGGVYSLDAYHVLQLQKQVKTGGYLTTNKYLREFGPQDSDGQDHGNYVQLQKIDIAGASGQNQSAKRFNLLLSLVCGDYNYSQQDRPYILQNCSTPIVTGFRIDSRPKQKQPDDFLDVSGLVMQYSDSWSANDYHSISHTGRIQLLINPGMDLTNECDLSTPVDQVIALHKRGSAFWIQVYAGYNACNYSGNKLQGCAKQDQLIKLFSGICFGGSITKQAGKRIFSAEIHDYSKILEQSYMFNSPFYDGVRDVNVARDIIQSVGFNMTTAGSLIDKYAQNPNSPAMNEDGKSYQSDVYVLPNSYAKLTNPFWKFQDSSKQFDNLMKMTKLAGKCLYFDRCGIFHYDVLPYDKALFETGNPNDMAVDWFFTEVPCNVSKQNGVILALERVELQRDVPSVFNIIHSMTGSPSGVLTINDIINKESIVNPKSQGYIGYRKMFLQHQGVFGNDQSLKRLNQHYKKFFKAPVVMKWKSMACPIQALQVACIDGQKLVAINVSNTISATDNSWYTQIEGESFFGQTYNKI